MFKSASLNLFFIMWKPRHATTVGIWIMSLFSISMVQICPIIECPFGTRSECRNESAKNVKKIAQIFPRRPRTIVPKIWKIIFVLFLENSCFIPLFPISYIYFFFFLSFVCLRTCPGPPISYIWHLAVKVNKCYSSMTYNLTYVFSFLLCE